MRAVESCQKAFICAVSGTAAESLASARKSCRKAIGGKLLQDSFWANWPWRAVMQIAFGGLCLIKALYEQHRTTGHGFDVMLRNSTRALARDAPCRDRRTGRVQFAFMKPSCQSSKFPDFLRQLSTPFSRLSLLRLTPMAQRLSMWPRPVLPTGAMPVNRSLLAAPQWGRARLVSTDSPRARWAGRW